MLITKFNKMVRNKKLWGFFAILVCISFVGVYSNAPKSGGCSGDMSADSAGKIFGINVSHVELEKASFFTTRMRRISTESTEQANMLRRLAWQRIASLKMAEKMGITVSEQELAEMLARDPAFVVNGAFSKERFEAVRTQIGASSQMFEEYLKQEMVLQKMTIIMESCVWVSPVELNERLSKITDIFSMRYATFEFEKNIPVVAVSVDDAKKYFEANTNRFMVSEQVSVKYVEFPISNNLTEVKVSEADIGEYYTNNIEKYTSVETNSLSTNTIYSVTPIESVRTKILAELKHDKAETEAKNLAAKFAASLLPDRNNRAPSFDKIAANNKLNICTTEYFSMRDDIPKLRVGREFNMAAFDLDPADPSRCFSDPVTGEDSVYVLTLKERRPAHLPEFNSIIDKVTKAAKRDAEVKAFVKKCSETRDTVANAIKEGKSFNDALKGYNANVSTSMTFAVYEAASNPFEHFELIVPEILTMSKGEVTKPMETSDGAIIACILDRKPGDLQSAEMLKPELRSTMERTLSLLVYDGWKEYLLSNGGLVDPVSAMPGDEADKTSAGASK